MLTLRDIALALDPRTYARLIDPIRAKVTLDSKNLRYDGVDEYLDAHGVRAEYRKATSNWVDKVLTDRNGRQRIDPVSVDLLLYCLTVLDVGVTDVIADDTRSYPWSLLPERKTVLALFGSRLVPFYDTETLQRYISHRDDAAKREFVRFLHHGQHLNCFIDEQCFPIEMSPDEAQDAFKKYRDRRDIGMIIVFGSPVVNPMAVPIARAILKNADLTEAPGWFEWDADLNTRNIGLSRRPQILRDRQPTTGVRLAAPVAVSDDGEPNDFFPRVQRRVMVERFKQGDQGPFEDAGILMLDTVSRPMLCLAAGHGGCGTLAALRALLHVENISSEMTGPGACSVLGEGRLMQAIKVNCWKKSPRPDVDDLDFGDDDWWAYTLRSQGGQATNGRPKRRAAKPR